MTRTDTLIIGAGLAGLGCALRTGGDFLVCEKGPGPGGLCTTSEKNGFLFDTCAHLLHFRNPKTRDFITNDLGVELNTFRKNAFIQTGKTLIRHPFQYHLNGLEREEAVAALLGFINARLNPFYPAYYSEDTFRDWLLRTFGEGICSSFMLPYNRKFWKVPLEEITCEWTDRFIGVPSLEQVIEGALFPVEKEYGYNSTFMYPSRGGIARIAEKMAEKIAGRVLYRCKITHVDVRRKIARTADGGQIAFRTLVCTLPLPDLRDMVRPLPEDIYEKLGSLRYLSVLNVNFGTAADTSGGRNWVYCPEPETTCFRFGFPSTYSACAPSGKGNAYTETTCLPGHDIGALKARVENEMKARGTIGPIETTDTNFVRCAYVIFDRNRQKSLPAIREWAEANGIRLCGRYGNWDYMSMEESLLDGMNTAARINSERQTA